MRALCILRCCCGVGGCLVGFLRQECLSPLGLGHVVFWALGDGAEDQVAAYVL